MCFFVWLPSLFLSYKCKIGWSSELVYCNFVLWDQCVVVFEGCLYCYWRTPEDREYLHENSPKISDVGQKKKSTLLKCTCNPLIHWLFKKNPVHFQLRQLKNFKLLMKECRTYLCCCFLPVNHRNLNCGKKSEEEMGFSCVWLSLPDIEN